jgi:hypothetical protein
MSQSSTEARILLALQAIQNNPNLSLRHTAGIYNIDYYALRRCQQGIQSRCDSILNSRKLSDLEE